MVTDVEQLISKRRWLFDGSLECIGGIIPCFRGTITLLKVDLISELAHRALWTQINETKATVISLIFNQTASRSRVS